ncbi:flagellar hook-length control protein FliK [Sphingomonas sp. CJ20]
MIQPLPAPAPALTGALRPPQLATGAAGDFSSVLAAAAAPDLAIAVPGVRQMLAGDGKDLPDGEAIDLDSDTDSVADPAFAWFAMPVAPIAVATPLGSVGAPAPQTGVAGPLAPMIDSQKAAAVPLSPPSQTEPVEAAARAPDLAGVPPAPDGATPDVARAPLAVPVTGEAPTPPKGAQPVAAPVAPPVAQGPAPEQQPAPLAPAAAAIAPLFQAQAEPIRPLRRELGRDLLATAGAAPLETSGPAPAVQATAQAQNGTLDLRHQQWTGQMIERIEALRDAAPIGETRIRLAPDALGTVDIAIRHEGERVHVHFTADVAATRQALSDAQPRLAELAEARGLRLGQTSVDGGSAGQGGQPGARPDTAPRQPTRPASALTDPTPETDDRIA